MALGNIPPPLQHPVIGRDGLVTVTWASYFRELAVTVDNAGFMLQSTYDPTSSGSVNDSDELGGQPGSYYLDLTNATGYLPVGQSQWHVRAITASATSAVGDFCDVDATAAAVVITMPAAAGNSGLAVAVRKNDTTANTVTVSAASINGSATQVITAQYTAIVMVSNGSEWCIV